MTLVLSCATPDYVFQVSDRRLTALGDPTHVVDDNSNKSVVVGGRLAFGYTGLSRVGGEQTDLWLARTLKDRPTRDLAAVCEHLRVDATEAFRQLARSRGSDAPELRHAFAGVGWVRRPDASSFEALHVTVSNAIEPAGEWRDTPAREFSTAVDQWRDYGGFKVQAIGAKLEPVEKKAIWRHLSRLVRKGAGPSAMLRALIDSALFVASRRSSVGRRLLGLCIPRVAAERCAGGQPFAFLAGLPTPRVATFAYVSESGVGPVHFGPHVTGDGTMMTGVECGPL